MKSRIRLKKHTGHALRVKRPARTLGELDEMMRELAGIGAGPKRKTNAFKFQHLPALDV